MQLYIRSMSACIYQTPQDYCMFTVLYIKYITYNGDHDNKYILIHSLRSVSTRKGAVRWGAVHPGTSNEHPGGDTVTFFFFSFFPLCILGVYLHCHRLLLRFFFFIRERERESERERENMTRGSLLLGHRGRRYAPSSRQLSSVIIIFIFIIAFSPQ